MTTPTIYKITAPDGSVTFSDKPQAMGRIHVRQANGTYKTEAELKQEEQAKRDEEKQKREARDTQIQRRKAAADTQLAIDEPIARQKFLEEHGTFEQFAAKERAALSQAAGDVSGASAQLTSKLQDSQLLMKQKDTFNDHMGYLFAGLGIAAAPFSGGLSLGISTVSIAGGYINDKDRIKTPGVNGEEFDGGGALSRAGISPEQQAANGSLAAAGDFARNKIPLVRAFNLADDLMGGYDAATAYNGYGGFIPGSDKPFYYFQDAPMSQLESLGARFSADPTNPYKETLAYLKDKGINLRGITDDLIAKRKTLEEARVAYEKKQAEYDSLRKAAMEKGAWSKWRSSASGTYSDRK